MKKILFHLVIFTDMHKDAIIIVAWRQNIFQQLIAGIHSIFGTIQQRLLKEVV